MTDATIVAVSLKAYFGHARAREWMSEVAALVGTHPAVTTGAVRVVVLPTYLQIPAALETFAGTAVQVGAQDVSAHPPGPYTGEVTAAELAEIGVRVVETGHAERRRLFGETDADTAAKSAAALTAGLTPLLCVGEPVQEGPAAAATTVTAQLNASLADAPAGAVFVAYEPVWAIGAECAASSAHVAAVTAALRRALESDPDRAGSAVVYGGAAGPGLLTELGTAVDGVFLGRFAHDPTQLLSVVEEAAARSAVGA